MVSTNDIDGAIGQTGAHRLDIISRTQRRIHLVHRVVCGCQFVGEDEVMRRHFGGDVDTARLGPANDVDGTFGGEMAHV